MSAVDIFIALAAVADRVRKRDMAAFTAQVDAAIAAAGDEPGADHAQLYIDYIALDKFVPRTRAPIRYKSSLPTRVEAAQAEAYMRALEKRISRENDDADDR